MAKPVLLLRMILGLGLLGGIGCLELGDSCDSSRYPSSSNPLEYDSYTKCDPRQGLYCEHQTSRCDCYVVDSEYIDDTCRGKIGFPCKASPTFTIACGENAYCEEQTGFCRCEEDYMALPTDKFNCSSAKSFKSSMLSTFLTALLALSMMTVLLCQSNN